MRAVSGTGAGIESEGPSALRTYLAAVRRRRMLVALCVLGGLALGVLMFLRQPTEYQASAQVVLSRNNLAANAVTGTTDPTAYASDFLRIVQTQAEVARAPQVAREVVRRVPEARLSPTDFLDNSTVAPQQDADMLIFTATSGYRGLAEKLATTYAQAFVDYRRFLDSSSIATARGQLGARIRRLASTPAKKAQNAALIASLTSKEQELRTLQVLQTANATVTSPATDATHISPRPKRTVALGLLLGLILAAFLVWIRELLDTRLRTVEELEGRLGLPLLGHLMPPPERLGGRALMLAEPRSPEAESFRILRTNLSFALIDRTVKAVMITSSVEREGKSTTIINLAVSMAQAGKRVALIDLDLRRPSVAKVLDLGPGQGFTDVALGRTDLEDALVSIPVPATLGASAGGGTEGRLDVLRSGPLPPDPGEFVGSTAVASIIGQLRDEYDLVLIDAPPVLQASDAMTLSKAVDALFVVTRLGVVRRPMIEMLARSLANSPAPVLGFVVTGDTKENAEYGYGYGYGYGAAPEAAPVAEDRQQTAV